MLNNTNNNHKCGFADEIVSYIYDEITVADRRSFEAHLASCSMCTDEFAAVSNARFSVFEWQKTEFARLSTPEIVIPYAAKQKNAGEGSSAGLLADFREFFAVLGRPMMAAAALVLCIGFGFLVITYLGDRENQIATVPDAVPPVNIINAPKVTSTPDEPTPEGTLVKASETRSMKAADRQRRAPNRQVAVERSKVQNAAVLNTAQQIPKPVLGNYDESDDKSLRLADLFDEVGGGS